MRASSFQHEFVEYIPSEPSEGVVYVSIPFATAVHKCACGCGNEVVTPLSPTDWRLTFDGKTVSLYPSIGNWSFPCRSHYWIKRDAVTWAPRMSRSAIEIGRRKDRWAKEAYFAPDEAPELEFQVPAEVVTREANESAWSKLKRRLFGS